MDSRTLLYSTTVLRIWDHWHTDLSVLPWIHFEPLQLLKFYFDADADPVPSFDLNADPDPDPAFHSDVDPDPDSTSQSDADPCEPGYATLV